MISYELFEQRARAVLQRIADACASAGRKTSDVTLLPVTKTHPVDAVAYVARFGLKSVGENRVQEALDKQRDCAAAVDWELIGHLQSNKARLAAEHFARVQSVDSLKLLRLLDRAAEAEGRPLRILLQINAGNDPAKFGADPEQAPALLEAALGHAHLRVEGLMTIAPLDADPEVARRTFANLRGIRDRLAKNFGVALAELSMGMSGDLEAAITEGSTCVRVGSALFGERH